MLEIPQHFTRMTPPLIDFLTSTSDPPDSVRQRIALGPGPGSAPSLARLPRPQSCLDIVRDLLGSRRGGLRLFGRGAAAPEDDVHQRASRGLASGGRAQAAGKSTRK